MPGTTGEMDTLKLIGISIGNRNAAAFSQEVAMAVIARKDSK